MKKEEKYLSLEAKIQIAKLVISDSFKTFKRSAVVWSAGKDSTVVLNLVEKVSQMEEKNIPPSIFIDHGQHYDETYKMVSEISKEKNFIVIYAKNENFLNNVEGDKVSVDRIKYTNSETRLKLF